MTKKTKGSADQMDKHVGHRLRLRRSLMGISQDKMAECAGVTFQQVQKYERGLNRISASRLYQFSKFLQVPITYFYEGGDEDESSTFGLSDNAQSPFGEEDGDNIMERKETLELVRNYYAIKDEKVRQNFLKLLKSMAKEEESA